MITIIVWCQIPTIFSLCSHHIPITFQKYSQHIPTICPCQIPTINIATIFPRYSHHVKCPYQISMSNSHHMVPFLCFVSFRQMKSIVWKFTERGACVKVLNTNCPEARLIAAGHRYICGFPKIIYFDGVFHSKPAILKCIYIYILIYIYIG